MTVPFILIHWTFSPALFFFYFALRVENQFTKHKLCKEKSPSQRIFYFHMHNTSLRGTAHPSSRWNHTHTINHAHTIYIAYIWLQLLTLTHLESGTIWLTQTNENRHQRHNKVSADIRVWRLSVVSHSYYPPTVSCSIDQGQYPMEKEIPILKCHSTS